MSNGSDEVHSVALGVILVPLVLVGALVLAIAIQATSRAGPGAKSHPQVAASAESAASPAAARGEAAAPAVEALHFDAESAVLPFDALPVLARIADRARADAARVVRIAAFHAPGADALRAFALALERSDAVRHALEAHGVPLAQLQVTEPVRGDLQADARVGQRVELRLE